MIVELIIAGFLGVWVGAAGLISYLRVKKEYGREDERK